MDQQCATWFEDSAIKEGGVEGCLFLVGYWDNFATSKAVCQQGLRTPENGILGPITR